jgi:MFS superfamily sulfate permease-like transporter
VGFAQSIAIAKSYAVEHHYNVDGNQEMLAYGAANIGAGLLQGYTITGSLSKSAATQEARARSPLAPVFTGALVLLTVLFLAGLFRNLPEAILAAIVIEAVSGMLKPGKLTALRRARSVEFWAALGALAGVVLIDILPGVVIGVAISFALLIHSLDHPRITRLGRTRDGSRYVDSDADKNATTLPRVLIERFEAPLVFTNAELFRSEMLQRVHDTSPHPRVLVLDFEAVTEADATGADALRELHAALEREDVRLIVARPHAGVRTAMDRSGVLSDIGAANVVPTVHAAVGAAAR